MCRERIHLVFAQGGSSRVFALQAMSGNDVAKIRSYFDPHFESARLNRVFGLLHQYCRCHHHREAPNKSHGDQNVYLFRDVEKFQQFKSNQAQLCWLSICTPAVCMPSYLNKLYNLAFHSRIPRYVVILVILISRLMLILCYRKNPINLEPHENLVQSLLESSSLAVDILEGLSIEMNVTIDF